MLTITTLKDSAYSSIGNWMASVVDGAKSEDDQNRMSASIALFIIEAGQGRALVGERDGMSHILFVYPEGPMLTHRSKFPVELADTALKSLRDEVQPVDCVIASLNGTDWNEKDGFHMNPKCRTVSIHFNFGYKSLSFITTVRESDPDDKPLWMIRTDSPSDCVFDGWARWLTPIETVNGM